MTADERIEKLLNRYGQTIADLPAGEMIHQGVIHQVYGQPNQYGFLPKIYGEERSSAALIAACQYHHLEERKIEYLGVVNRLIVYEDYICHLADIIDRMEAALETATRWYPCECCEYGFTDDYWAKTCPCYKGGEYEESGFRIADKLLIDEQED